VEQNVLAKTETTSWDSLIVTITASDMDTLVHAVKFSSQDSYTSLSFDDVPSGKQRTVNVVTKTKAGVLIHVSSSQTVDISPAEKKVLDFTLVPVRGSIYIDLSSIPTTVKEICATFGGDTVCETRSTKLYMSIDYVLDKTSDSLIINGTDSTGAVIYHSAVWLDYSVLNDTTISTVFCKISTNVTISVTAELPGVTVVTGIVNAQDSIAFESGALIISEIMYNANDSEYVELYNPKSTAYSDSLILEIDGTCRPIGVVTIKSNGFYVIGRKSIPWADAYPSVASALDLSSGGNWLCVRNHAAGDTVLDWVAFTGSSNDQDWPNLGSAKKSIIIDTLPSDPLYNNYGRNWTTAQTLISSLFTSVSTAQYGTPKSSGF
jgi:hypothetical protein